MKTRRVAGFVAVAFAYAYACGGSPATSIPTSTTYDAGGAAESGGVLTVTDARAGDEGKVASGRSEGGAEGGAGAGAVDGATNAAPSSSSSQYCCVGGAYYACPSQAALAQCTGFDVSGCLQSCSLADAACTPACGHTSNTNPSACTHDPSNDALCASFDAGSSTSSAAPAPPPLPTNPCGGLFPPDLPCGVGGTCIGGGHCAQNRCYPNDVGNPCTYPSDCGDGNHCTNGCCASPAKGSACSAFWDCKSKACTNGVCQ